ncbi:Ribosome maturation factor RimM [Pelotomaculum schinkii]|uniref:Ribosome maturation factor RimM n=1 Tax=Pelotomaculum schinkii TaxID=78350 RepID=A0A4Y7R9U1_9FIRM|nr:ribosome maturation factor RimM [Pelotomaculum schinkii]TEB05479.1 Ribosome maturation factor RimM [Pelotomaculum schinkii]
MSDEFIRIGKILKSQGHRGAVRVLPLTDFPERFQGMKRVRVKLRDGGADYTIEEIKPHGKFLTIKFKEITDMDAADKLRDCYLEVTRQELVPLQEGSYYIFDIVGMSVFDLDQTLLGKVTDVLQTGANDVYVVETAGKPLLIPALKQVVREIDLPGRRMLVELPEGLAD